MFLRKHLLVFFVVPLFFVGFGEAYKPFDLLHLCDYGFFHPAVHIVLLGCILMGTLLISRVPYYFVDRAFKLNWWQDLLWILGETFIASFFIALYIALFDNSEYFTALGTSFQLVYSIVIYPYAILCLVDALIRQVNNVNFSQDPENVIHFYDENQHQKLVIKASSVLFIKADNNSVRINYLDSDRIKEYVLRTSMSRLQPVADKYHLVRCQRSYYINPTYVKVLRKDKEGFIYAELGIADVNPIPVSKTYYDNLAAIL